MRLTLIRHAQAIGNRERYIGWEDAELTPAGRRQCVDLADALKGESIEAIYCSPLSRTIATAAPLAHARGISPQLRDGLKEINYGRLQGTIKGARPFKLRKTYLHSPMPDGESLHDVWQRLRPMTEEITQMLRSQRPIAVIGHYWTNRLLLGQLNNLPLESVFKLVDYKPVNASAYRLEFVRSGEALVVFGMTRVFPAGVATDEKDHKSDAD